MKAMTVDRIRCAVVVCAALMLICPWSANGQRPAADEWADGLWREVSNPSWRAIEKVLRPSSTVLEQSFIWDVMTMEQVSRNDHNAVIEAYEASGWKPIFIDANLNLSQGALEFQHRLEMLDQDAIDPVPYDLKGLKESLHRVALVRAGIESLKPRFIDAAVKAYTALAAQHQNIHTTSDLIANFGRVSSDSSGKASPLTDIVANLEQKYKELMDAVCAVDISLTSNLIRYCADMDPFSQERRALAFSGQLDLSEFLKSLDPVSERYQVLRKTYEHYRDIGNGASQESKAPASTVGSDGVSQAREAQWRNLPNDYKVRLLGETLKIMRQSKTRSYDRFVKINIPEYMLEYYNDGKLVAEHRVVVGKASGKKIKFRGQMVGENQTPTLDSRIARVIFNPRWYLSDRIHREYDSKVAEDPGYFAHHGYVAMPSTYKSGAQRIFQPPGPKNALGKVKFEFENPYAVYLHDTPSKGFFQRARRDFSHGCVRVDKAVDLAREILEDDNNPIVKRINDIVLRYHLAYVELNRSVPIIIEYMPVTVDTKGQLVYCGDPYGLFAHPPVK